MKQQHQNSENAGQWEPSGLPKSICWHDTYLRLVGDGIGGPQIFVPIHVHLTCNPTISARHCLAESESESEVRMPKRQPFLGREQRQKK